MTIKVNENLLSIPPYISTSWDQIATLHVSGAHLIVHLIDSTVLTIPNLDSELLSSIFRYHSQYLELESEISDLLPSFPFDPDTLSKELIEHQLESGNIRVSIGAWNGLGAPIEHNPEQSQAPELPKEILQKIAAITKIINPDNTELPKAEPNCNCFYCQVARAMNASDETEIHVKESSVPPSKWHVEQAENNLYIVSNLTDNKEQYNVHLGEPLGCTCGQIGCEHIVAVLKS